MSSWEEFYSDHRVSLPPHSAELTEYSTHCLVLRSLEGFKPSLLPSLSPDTPINSYSTRSARGKSKPSDNFKLDGFTLRIHLFDFESKQFLGRTWVSPPFKLSQEDKKSFSLLGHTLYFQLPNNFPTYFVIEFVTKVSQTDSPVFWTSFDPFAHTPSIPDFYSPSRLAPIRIPLFYGSPRALFFLRAPLLDSRSPVPVPGCLLICSLSRHRALQCLSHLFPPFYLLSPASLVPGLAYPSRQPGRDPLASPKLLETLPCLVSDLSLEFSQDFSALSQRLLASQEPAGARITEMKLRVGIHNGLTFVHQPKILYLERDRHSEQTLRAIGSLQLDDLISHPLVSLVFQLDIQIQFRNVTSPVQSPLHPKALKTFPQKESRSDPIQLSLSLSWGAWSPFSGVPAPPHDPLSVGFRLHTGPGVSPYNVPVLRGEHAAHIRFLFTHWTEPRPEEGARLKRSSSSTSVPTPSLRGQLPRRSHSQVGLKALRKRIPPTSPQTRPVSSSATPPISLAAFESALSEDQLRGGSVPHLDRVQDSSVLIPGSKRSNSSLAYSSLSRVCNVNSAGSTPASALQGETAEPAAHSVDTSVRTHPTEEVESPVEERDSVSHRIISRDHTALIQVPHSQTPVYVPAPPAPAPQLVETKQGLSRADYALIHNSGFPAACSDKNAESNNLQTPQSYPSRVCLSVQFMAFQLPPNPTENILEGFASLALFEAPKQVFCTYKLFKWQPNTTPKLFLVKKEIKPSDKKSSPYILMQESDSIPGYLSGYQVTSQSHIRELISYLQQYKVQFDLWNGESLMLIGSGFVSLSELAGNAMEATQLIREIDICSLDAFSSNNDLLVLDQNGQFCHSQGRTVQQGNLVIRFAFMPDFAESQIGRFQHFQSLDTTNNNPVSYGEVHQQTTRETRRVSKARHMAATDDNLSKMLHSYTGLPDKSNMQTGKENSRKLERMRMVRGVSSQKAAKKIGSSSQVKRRKDFQVLDLYRKDHKSHKIDSLLTDSICSEIAFDAASGIAYYFEHELKNPFNETLVILIEIPDQSITVVSRANELRYFKNLYNSLTPIEDDLIHFGEQNEPQIFLQPKESVYVPFKYQSYQIRPPSHNSKHFDEFKIPIKFLTLEKKPVSVLTFKVKPQPTLTDFTMHFYHPERIFFKKTFLLPSTMFPHPSGNISDGISAISSDKNVFAVVSRSEVGDSFQLHLKVACDTQVHQHTFYVLLYNNRFLSKPTQTWEICIHQLSRIDMNCTFGQSSYAKVYLKGTAFTRVVQAFSSHPRVLHIQPKDNFVLSANSMMEICLGVRPTFTGSRNMCVNVVDREMSQIIQQWIVCINSQEPNVSRSFQIVIPTSHSKITTKKIAFKNPYSKKKEFFLHTSRADVLSFKENNFQVNGLTPHTIFLKFKPVSYTLESDILIFINDNHDNTEECFCVQVSYQNV